MRQIVGGFRAVNRHGFFSHIGSSAQRLPNGNLFVCSDTEGHFFEVNGRGELAWEYINPVTRDGAVKALGDVLPMTNSVFRAHRIGVDHPALQGRDLTARGPITDLAPDRPSRRPKPRPEGKDRRPDAGDGNGAAPP